MTRPGTWRNSHLGGKSGWQTINELMFLENLGDHTPKNCGPRKEAEPRRKFTGDRSTLLRQYRDSMHKRADWGQINRCEVEEYLCEVEEYLLEALKRQEV